VIPFLSRDELARRLRFAFERKAPSINALAAFTRIDHDRLRDYARRTADIKDANRRILSDFFAKWDMGLYQVVSVRTPGLKPRQDIVPAEVPRPPTLGCVTLSVHGPRLRFKTTAEVMGFEICQPLKVDDARRTSSRLHESSKNTVV
jgi:hypothetical protein